jgi:hypothetical protein
MSNISAYLTKQLLKELSHYLDVVDEMRQEHDLPANVYEMQSRQALEELILLHYGTY